MHERYCGSKMADNGRQQLASRKMLVRALLAFAVLSILILPVSVAEAHVSLRVEDGGLSFPASGTGGTFHAAGATVPHQRELPVTVTAGEEFEVTVTFAAPADGFHAIGLTDVVPAGWKVSVDLAWTEPQAILAHTPEPEEAVYIWMGPFAEGVEFTAVYKVMVPVDAVLGTYIFSGSLEYYVEPFPAPSYWATPTGDIQVQVVDAVVAAIAGIAGVIKEVDGTILPGAAVILYRNGQPMANAISDENGNYALAVPGFGDYDLVASKRGFRDEAQSISVTEPTTHLLDFAGDHGLIPNAPSRPYVLACVNLWQLDDPSLQLSTPRLLDVISASKYPSG